MLAPPLAALQGEFYEAVCKDIDPVKKQLVCCFPADSGLDEACFQVSYDVLLMGVGAWGPWMRRASRSCATPCVWGWVWPGLLVMSGYTACLRSLAACAAVCVRVCIHLMQQKCAAWRGGADPMCASRDAHSFGCLEASMLALCPSAAQLWVWAGVPASLHTYGAGPLDQYWWNECAGTCKSKSVPDEQAHLTAVRPAGWVREQHLRHQRHPRALQPF